MTSKNERTRPERRLGRLGVLGRRVLTASLFIAAISACSGSGPQSSLEPEGPIAQDIDDLWEFVLILATIVLVIVLAVFVISLIRFRERKDDQRRPRQVHGNTRLEIAWTILPAVLLAVLAVPTVQGIFDIRTPPEGPDVLQIKVTGHQWWWEFEYPDITSDDGRTLLTANELHIPAGTRVNLTMTSADVIHSFWVPPLNGKRDVVPGRVSFLTLVASEEALVADNGFGPGVVLGQCAEFCGLAHADMRLRVFVETPEDFEAWAQQQLEPAAVPTEGAAAAGFETFNQVCTACHQATVSQPDGTVETIGLENFIEARGADSPFWSSFGPNLTHFGSRTTFGGASLDNVTDHLTQWLANPSDLKPMAPEYNDLAEGRILGMPNFGLAPDEIANLVELLQRWE